MSSPDQKPTAAPLTAADTTAMIQSAIRGLSPQGGTIQSSSLIVQAGGSSSFTRGSSVTSQTNTPSKTQSRKYSRAQFPPNDSIPDELKQLTPGQKAKVVLDDETVMELMTFRPIVRKEFQRYFEPKNGYLMPKYDYLLYAKLPAGEDRFNSDVRKSNRRRDENKRLKEEEGHTVPTNPIEVKRECKSTKLLESEDEESESNYELPPPSRPTEQNVRARFPKGKGQISSFITAIQDLEEDTSAQKCYPTPVRPKGRDHYGITRKEWGIT